MDDLNDTTKSWILSLLQELQTLNENTQHSLEERLQIAEQQLALLVSAYTELAANLQSTISTLLADGGSEKRELFYQALKESRTTMIETLRNAAVSAERAAPTFTPHSSVTS